MKSNDSQARKAMPLFSGCLMYFPDALLAVAEHSKKANDKHNPGEPLHWSKEKSKDHADCIARHLIDIGPNWNAVDSEFGSMHATALAWRALALLQTVIEREKTAAPQLEDAEQRVMDYLLRLAAKGGWHTIASLEAAASEVGVGQKRLRAAVRSLLARGALAQVPLPLHLRKGARKSRLAAPQPARALRLWTPHDGGASSPVPGETLVCCTLASGGTRQCRARKVDWTAVSAWRRVV